MVVQVHWSSEDDDDQNQDDPMVRRSLYGVHDREGSYEVMDAKSCMDICGPKSLKRDRINEDDWVLNPSCD